MHEWGDSGITAVLLAIGVAVLLSLVLAQQARTRAARYKEIRRLQSVAAEEARREEEEAHTEYNSMVARGNYCAVCFNPTSTRCSRCKAVRYCSSTCQVKHWKDGHKQECRAPNPIPSPESSSNGSRSFSEVFSSNGSAGSGGSGTLSEISEVHTEEEDATQVALARRDDTPEANGNGSLLKPKKVLFPYEYFVKFFNWERLKVPPCGLLNCGNSCFANVVLQCLTYTRPLTAYLLEGTHGEECRRSEWCFMCELQDHVWRVRQSQNPFSPIRILSRIRNIGNHLGYGRQEDAHEFMRFAIDSMQSICLDEAGGEKAVDPRSQETTFIHYIFGGHLQSQVKCMQCLHESNRYENMMDLAVEIHGCVETLEDALTQFTAPEWLDGENKYKCDRCNAYVKARKRLTLHEAPNILTIALKRFQSGKFGKLNKRVTFPEVLDVSPYMSGKGDMPPLYRLYAVVVHVDMLNASFFGHYICYVKDSQGLWYKIDDSKVKEVDLEKVMAQRAYMLFYSRSSARPQPLLDGAVSIPYPVAEAVDMERISSDRHGGVKVFPSSNYPGSEEVLESGGSRGLHVMVDFNELLDNYVEYNSETVTEQEMLSNGEVATIHPSSWETERLRSSTPNNGEIETEDIACIASSSSLTETSPYISSFTSNQGLWIPTQGFVQCQVPGSGSVEGTEFAAWDPKSSLHDDFSEVSLQPCAAEMPCNNSKIGKRRLEDGLSPLPTPKPLDTDQLPAWPAGSQGRSNSCLPTVQHVSSPSPTISSIPGELHPPLQKYEPVIPAEASQSGAFPLQQRVSSNLVFLPPLGESNVEPEMADYSEMETTGLEMEEISVRPKRQHVETDAVTDLVVRIERPDDMLQTVEDSSSSDMGGSEMDWDAPIQHPGSLTSGAIWGPLPDPNGADSSADTMTTSASHGQEAALTYQPAALQSSVSLESGGLERSNESKAVEGNELEESSQGIDLAMESAEAPPELVGSLPHGGWQEEVLEAAACRPELTRQDEPLQSVDQDVTLHDGDTTPAKQPLSSTETHTTTVESENDPVRHSNGPALQLSDTPGNGGKSKSKPKPLFAPGFLNKARSPAGAKVKSSSNTSGKPVAAVENGHVKQVEEEGGAFENVAANDQKCSANGDSNTSGKPGAALENGHVKQVEEEGGASEHVAANDQECSSNGDSRAKENVAANDQKCSSNGESQAKDVDELRPTEGTPLATLNDDTSTTAANGEVPSCGDCMNCDTCNSAHSDSRLENGHQKDQQVSGTTPDSNDNHIVKNRSKNDPGVASSSKTRPNSGVNGNGPSSHNSRRVNNNDEKPGAEPVTDAGTAVSSRPAANGKQKQGRNETCNCGSQRKWKKCCGQTGLIKAERQTRRLLV